MRGKLLYGALVLLPLLLTNSCIKEEAGIDGPGGESTVTVTIHAPGGARLSTRGMTETDQDEVKTIDVLAFTPGSGKFEYSARCSGSAIITDGTNSRLKKFSVTLREGTYDLLLIANVPDVIDGATLFGSTKAAVIADLEVGLPASGKWPADGSAPLPMWGQIDGIAITHGMSIDGNNAVKMTRAVAAVDIELSPAAQAVFEMESVYLYNYNKAGLLVPDVTDATVWDASTWQAAGPALPAAPGSTKGPLLYDNSDPAADKTKYEGEIYLFEGANGGAAKHPDIVCLVVGGTYIPTGQPAYYRVDFSVPDAGGNVTYKDILRNHKYGIYVNEVQSAGFPDEDQAYNSTLVDIDVTVTDWDLGGNIIMDPEGQRYLWVSDLEFELDGAGETVTLTIETDAKNWTIITSSSATDPAAGGASWVNTNQNSGIGGSHNISLTVPGRYGAYRVAYLHIKADNRLDAVIKVGQKERQFDIGEINPDLFSYGYVGAFWRADQTGERLIRMNASANGSAIYGDWTATVIEGADWIVLDTEQPAGGVEWNGGIAADMLNPANDAAFHVSGNSTIVSGTCASDATGEIYFRIGLKSRWSDDPQYDPDNNPARYGVILLTYYDNTKESLLFVRQGHEADYLMRPEDNHYDGTITTEWGGTAAIPRPLARKFSMYNVTATEFNSGSVADNIRLNRQDGTATGNPGSFTEYPSQAGAFFKWAGGSGEERLAYNPVLNNDISSDYNNSYWDGLKAEHETCPPGYRRFSDGNTSTDNNSIAVSDSEMRQSLFFSPQPDAAMYIAQNPGENFLQGYLADGYFDRRQIENSMNYNYSAVKPNSSQVGYVGHLFYNPNNYSSLFFPESGFRFEATIGNHGYNGHYWSASSHSQSAGWYPSLIQSGVNVVVSSKIYAFPIRCVKN